MLNARQREAAKRRALGAAGEDAAAAILQREGLRIVARNWRQGSLELDLVCAEGRSLVFVEVRTRKVGAMVSPAETLTPAKRRSLFKAARAYLAATESWDRPCRFDVVCVTGTGQELRAEYFRNVFDVSEIMDSGHTAWQPW